jgi:hypothetical protein
VNPGPAALQHAIDIIASVAIHFQPGELVKTQDAPDVQDSRAEDVDAGFDTPAADKPDAKAGKAKAEKPKPKGQQP